MKRTLRKNLPSDLSFPDTSCRTPGAVQRDTVQAMRDARGNRSIAAQRLGITISALASRLSIIRGIQKSLENNGGSK